MLARISLIAAAVALSCGGTPGYRERAAALSRAGDVEAAIEELRIGLAEHPRDGAAHAALARLQDRAGRPGAALRHFERAARYTDLSEADRARLAMLHVERARARIRLGDGDAWRDIEAAARRVDVDDDLRADAYRAGVRAALAYGDARPVLRRLAAVDPADPRLAILEPAAADLSTLGKAAQWAWDTGARRAGHDLLVAYVDRGGRTPDLVRRWIEARLWWRGRDAALSPEIVDTWIRGGGDACLPAYRPADYDCESLARPTEALRDRARRLRWRAEHPHLAEVLAALALRDWAAAGGDGPRPDVARVADRTDLAALAPYQRALIMAEATGEHAEVALAGPVPAYAWIAPAAAARAAGDADLEQQHLEQAGSYVFAYLAARGELARLVDQLAQGPQGARYRSALERWSAAMDPDGGADPAMPFGGPDPYWIAHAAGLRDAETLEPFAGVARAYRRDPAFGLRKADDFVDAVVAAGERAPAVIELLIQLGEPAHALARAQQLVDASPRHAPYLALAGTAAAAVGDVEQAEIHFIAAAAHSGDAGAANLAAARTYVRFGHDVAAIAAGRRALELTPPGEDPEVLLLLARAMLRLRRVDNAAAVVERYHERVATPLEPTTAPALDDRPIGVLLSIALTTDGERRAAALRALEAAAIAAGNDDLAAAARRAAKIP